PFPAEALHSFTHVRYTPHLGWSALDQLPQADFASPGMLPESRYLQMLKDSVRYVPALRDCEYVRSLWEVKTTLGASERNDGRPILFKRDYGLPGLHIVMGGKIDNVFDILQGLRERGVSDPAADSGDNGSGDVDYYRSLFHVP